MEHKFKWELETTDEREAKEITDFIEKLNEKYRLKIPQEDNSQRDKTEEMVGNNRETSASSGNIQIKDLLHKDYAKEDRKETE